MASNDEVSTEAGASFSSRQPSAAHRDAAGVLREARGLLAAKRWTTGVYARDEAGRKCFPASPNAACFCATGALRAVTESPDGTWAWPDCSEIFGEAWDLLSKAAGSAPEYFNDEVAETKEEVLDAFDRAIALADARHREKRGLKRTKTKPR